MHKSVSISCIAALSFLFAHAFAQAQSCASIAVAAPGTATCAVPSGVSRLSYIVVGGDGGRGGTYNGGTGGGGTGGQVAGELAVTAGETYQLTVGINGHVGSASTSTGGGGGGYSALANAGGQPLIIAAGGGGGGARFGVHGGTAGQPGMGDLPGQAGVVINGGAGGGGLGGGYGAGGAGGNQGNAGNAGNSGSYAGGGGGGAGYGQVGGTGGAGGGNAGYPGGLVGGGGGGGGSSTNNASAGGGGGGGYAGGGGGNGGGGGGGSSLVPAGGTFGLGNGTPRIVLTAVLPSVSSTVSALTSTSVTLNAGVNAQWNDVTNIFFRHSETQAAVDDDTAPITTATPNALAAGTSASINANLSGLTPGATYHYRAYATNAGGTAATATQSFTTPKLVQTIVWNAAPSVAVNTVGTLSAAGGASGQPVIFVSQTPAACTVVGNQVSGLRSGTDNCQVAAHQAGTSSYDAAPTTTLQLSVAKGDQLIAWGTPPAIVVNGTGALAASGGASGQPITFSSTALAACAVSGNTLTGLQAGSNNCTVIAEQPGNSDYNAAPPAARTLSVGKGTQTVVWGAAPSVRFGAAETLSATGGASNQPVTFTSLTPTECTVSADQVTGLQKGSNNCALAADQQGNADYHAAPRATHVLSVGAGLQTIAWGAMPSVRVGEDGTLSATGGASGQPVIFTSLTPTECTVSADQITGLRKGSNSCTVAADQLGNADYDAAPRATSMLSVGAGSQSIVWQAMPPLTLGVAATLSAAGGASGMPVTFTSLTPTECGVQGAEVTGLRTGTDNCIVAADQAGDANYDTAAQATQTLSVSAAALVSVPSLSHWGLALLTVLLGGFGAWQQCRPSRRLATEPARKRAGSHH